MSLPSNSFIRLHNQLLPTPDVKVDRMQSRRRVVPQSGVVANLLWEFDTPKHCEMLYRDVRREATAEGCAIAPLELVTRLPSLGNVLGGTNIWGAMNQGRLIGVLALSRKCGGAIGEYLWLWGLYVRPPYRGTPASRALIEAALKSAEREPDGVRLFASY